MKHKPGPQSKLDKQFNLYELAYGMALLGATNPQIANALGVSLKTIEARFTKDVKFRAALRKGKDVADANVAKSLYRRAIGFYVPDIITTVVKRRNRDPKVILTPIRKYIVPDTTAMIFWLKSRQREKWADVSKVEHEMTNPILHKIQIDFGSFTKDELMMFRNAGLKLKRK